MGIRFERDSRKATNGPLFFFSIMKDESFEEEIRSAFISGLSFYAYRYPHDSMLCFGSSEGFIEGMGEPGFVIGMFEPSKPIITIPYHGTQRNENPARLYEMPHNSTTKEEYKKEVEQIIKDIRDGNGSKVVAARVIVGETEFDPAEKFYELCGKFPDAYVFCFGTPATGCWIGASPELLLRGNESVIESMALAGTRQADSVESWDEKNRNEQSIVADYIADIFKKANLNPEIGKTTTKTYGSIEHICTPIKSVVHGSLNISSLVHSLSPTPALCGSPKEFALNTIRNLENFDRGCYGGYCGPFHSNSDFTFNVVLRCASFSQKQKCIYVGGGITSQSNIEKEWEETEMKAKSVFG